MITSTASPSLTAVIACAMPEEIAPFLAAAENLKELDTVVSNQDPQGFFSGRLAGYQVLLVRSGIGLVNAGVAAWRALSLCTPELYILAGTTGGLAPQVEVGDIIAGTRTRFFDADATAFGYQLGQTPQMPADYSSELPEKSSGAEALTGITPHVGTVLSGNSFVTVTNAAERRRQFPGALAVDMESAAAAQVCYMNDVDWLSLRAVSDLCGPRADQDFHMGAESAANLSATAVTTLMRALPWTTQTPDAANL